MSNPSLRYNPGSGAIAPICVFPAEFDHEKDKIPGKGSLFCGLLDTDADDTGILPNVVEKPKLSPIENGDLDG